MSVFSTVTRRPKTVLIIFVVLLIFSISVVTNIPIDFQPSVEFNEVSVYTNYPGASPELIEDTITKPLERAINSIDNIEKVTSTTNEGSSSIFVTFKYKSGMDKNVDNLRSAVDTIENALPSEADKPQIFRFGASGDPVMSVLIKANRNHNEIREYVDNTLINYLEQINGVSLVIISGGVPKQIIIDVSLNRLSAYDLTLGELKKTIQANGYGGPIGTIDTTFKQVGVVFEGKYEKVEDVRNIIVAERKINGNDSVYVRLRDIADVSFRYGDESRQIYLNGKPAVDIIFFKDNDSNIVEVAQNIRNELKRLNTISPDDFEFEVFQDFSGFINRILSAVSSTALSGGLLALLVLILFLRNISSVASVAVSIPISIVLTIMSMYYYGITLNFMTLAGLAMGIGLIVDNSIVVLENIYIKRKNNVNLLPAAEYGVSEMAVPVFASTITTVLVFLPMLLFERELGVVGAYFTNLGFAIVVSIIISYLTAIFLVPVLTSTFIPLHINKTKGVIGKINSFFEWMFAFIENVYKAILDYIVLRRKRFILSIVVIAFLPFLLIASLGFNFLPSFAQEGIEASFTFSAGTTNEQMYTTALDFDERIRPLLPEVKSNQLEIVGGGSTTSIFDSGLYKASLSIKFTEFMQTNVYEKLLDTLNEITKEYSIPIRIGGLIQGGGPNFGGGFELKIQSDDLDKLKVASEQFSAILRNLPNFLAVRSDLPTSNIAISLSVDRERANAYGLTVRGVSDELKLAVSDSKVSTYSQGSKEYDIVMKLQDSDKNRADLFQQLYIKTPKSRIPLANLTLRDLSNAEQTILRENASRTVTLSARLAQGYGIDKAIVDSRQAFSQSPLSLDEDITYYFAGEFEDRNKTNRTLLLIFIFAVVFVFGVMASQFESFTDPFLIVFTIPLSFSGVILIYFFTANQLSAFSLAGVVILVGISVNHGIVLVDRINTLRARNYALMDAVVAGAKDRFQPILMTTLTTIGGMLPLALTSLAGAELLQPLALTLVGGLGTSSLLSLFFIPLIYASFHTIKSNLGAKGRKKRRAMKEENERKVLEQAGFTSTGSNNISDVSS